MHYILVKQSHQFIQNYVLFYLLWNMFYIPQKSLSWHYLIPFHCFSSSGKTEPKIYLPYFNQISCVVFTINPRSWLFSSMYVAMLALEEMLLQILLLWMPLVATAQMNLSLTLISNLVWTNIICLNCDNWKWMMKNAEKRIWMTNEFPLFKNIFCGVSDFDLYWKSLVSPWFDLYGHKKSTIIYLSYMTNTIGIFVLVFLYFLYFVYFVVPMEISPMVNSGRFPLGKPAATELWYPTLNNYKVHAGSFVFP